MEYYIQGNEANADKIKAAFEKLGFIKEDHRDIYENNVLFFTVNGDKNVHYCWIDQPYCNIIKTHPDYQELELPVEPKFKVNAWIVSNITKDIYQVKAVPEYFKLQAQGQYRLQSYTDGSISYFWKNDVENTCRLWEISDAKDGDVLVSRSDNPFIYNGNIEFSSAGAYIGVSRDGKIRLDMFPSKAWTSIKDVKPATNEQRVLLFKKIQEAGYQWYAGKKELKKIQPHYDIANFQPKQWVLVRDCNDGEWNLTMFSYLHRGSSFLFICINGVSFKQCIPLEGNEKLLGTTDMPSEEYINWKT